MEPLKRNRSNQEAFDKVAHIQRPLPEGTVLRPDHSVGSHRESKRLMQEGKPVVWPSIAQMRHRLS